MNNEEILSAIELLDFMLFVGWASTLIVLCALIITYARLRIKIKQAEREISKYSLDQNHPQMIAAIKIRDMANKENLTIQEAAEKYIELLKTPPPQRQNGE